MFLCHSCGIFYSADDVAVDGDDPKHIQWLFDKAKERADAHNIKGVTYRLTQGMSVLRADAHDIKGGYVLADTR